MDDLSKLTKTEIASRIKSLSKIANTKVKKVRAAGYENYNQSWIKKYNLSLNSKESPSISTKKGLFRSGSSHFTKEQLINRYEIMNEFVNNYYASAEYTEKHLADLRDKWNIKSDEAIKKMFDLYRDYGYDNYRDSDVLTSMAKIVNDGDILGEFDNAGEYLENVLQDIEDEFIGEGKTIDDYVKELQSRANILK
jgi:cell fate (sporulation/competence/biofilm development) regulator YlbF (YheA/YmcA/DUF963 family)